MTLHTWWLFVAMTFVVSATPGPNMLLVMSHSARFGLRAAVATMCGCMTSLLAMMSISAAGMGVLLHAFPAVFDAMRLAGAAYLAYLGVQGWRAPVADAAEPGATAAPAQPPAHLYRQGVLVAASNPKAILFAAAFFPQFLNPALPQLGQFAILLSTFAVVEVAWYLVYAVSGHKLSHYLRQARVMRVFNRVTGGIFVGFAAVMATVRE
ncbi:LysE family translocator [Rhodoferax sp. GW822-FHT02A01]|uniref:LysE family translocator n=1 Tax=Rhodoferax sp. GW822-FHT02A01 TaxID=3141537 RepID=UPI00315D7A51